MMRFTVLLLMACPAKYAPDSGAESPGESPNDTADGAPEDTGEPTVVEPAECDDVSLATAETYGLSDLYASPAPSTPPVLG